MKLAQAVILTLCFSCCAFCQEKKAQPTGISGFKSLIKVEGWTIPGLDISDVEAARHLVESSEHASPVYLTVFKPKKEVFAEIPSYSAVGYETLYLNVNFESVERIRRYEVGGRTFCYVVEVAKPGIGAHYYVLYYDEDGDGKFEKFERGAPQPRLPPWALRSR
jgi:hypothetical protein